jgi:hypothetical protein
VVLGVFLVEYYGQVVRPSYLYPQYCYSTWETPCSKDASRNARDNCFYEIIYGFLEMKQLLALALAVS